MERILYATTRFPRAGLQTTEGLADTSDRQVRTGAIVYIDNQRLTRDCVTEQLAMRLPEILIEAVAEVYDLSKEDIDTHRFALGILNKHSMHISKPELAKQLSFLATTAPNLPLALFSDLDEADDIAEAFKLGIRGYIPTSLPIQQAAEAIRLVSAGGSFLPPSILALSTRAGRVQAPSRMEDKLCEKQFTPRQLEVLRRLWQGKQNKLIAYELSMCESTVKVHIRHIMKKLNVRNRTQVVLLTRSICENGVAEGNG
jgi:DNA-binding NarL/FixJ family response regulator